MAASILAYQLQTPPYIQAFGNASYQSPRRMRALRWAHDLARRCWRRSCCS